MSLRAPAFWTDRTAFAARFLAPLGTVYGALTRWRMRRPGLTMNVPVICIGNPTVGGTGKTPFAAFLVAELRKKGARPAILTRGYGGALKGPVVVDPARHSAAEVGDEALLHAAQCLTVKAVQRVRGAVLAVDHGASHILLDDGFQNPALNFHLSFLLVDAAAGLGNGLIFPAGPLRTDFAAQAERAHALVLVGGSTGDVSAPAIERAFGLDRPIIRARLVPDPLQAAALKGERVLGFCGIGLPDKFRRTLATCGAEIVGFSAFADHHSLSETEAAALLQQADQLKARLVTTAKDYVKLMGSAAHEALAARALVLSVTVEIVSGQDVITQMLDSLG